MGKKGEGRRPQGADRKTRRLLVHTVVDVAGGKLWTEVHLEVTHGFVPSAQAEDDRQPSLLGLWEEVPVVPGSPEALEGPLVQEPVWADTESPAPPVEESCSSEEE